MLRNLAKLSLLILSLIFISSLSMVYADNYFPLRPRLYGGANFGPIGSGEADFLLPLYGNPGHISFLDAFVKVHNKNQWVGSLGLGYRLLWNDDLLVGAYLFGDQNRVNPSHFFVLNPGIEFMTNCWDGHLNAYAIVGDRSDVFGSRTAEAFVDGNNLFIRTFDLRLEAANGFDAILGYTLPNPGADRLRIFAGGYLFNYEHSGRTAGAVGGFDIPVTTPCFTIGLEDSYDKVHHNTAVLTLRVLLGGVPKAPIHVIHDRMTDPIPRHVAALESGAGIPTNIEEINVQTFLVRSNVFFFNGRFFVIPPGINFAGCTPQHPCNKVPIFNDVSGNICFENGNFVPCGEGNIVPF